MKYHIILLVLLSGFSSSCVATNVSRSATADINMGIGACKNQPLPVLLDSTNLKALFDEVAAELCTDCCSERARQNNNNGQVLQACSPANELKSMTVLVTDFADIQSFMPNQSGLLMGELMRGSLNKICCYKIVQAEFAKYFKLSSNGLVVLTRNVGEIMKDEYSHSDMIVGTYSYANNNKVVIFVRRINTETGKISRMVTREIDYSCARRSVMGYSVK